MITDKLQFESIKRRPTERREQEVKLNNAMGDSFCEIKQEARPTRTWKITDIQNKTL